MSVGISKQKGKDPKNASNNATTWVASFAEAPNVCPETGGRLKVGGPFWIAPLHKPDIVGELLRKIQPLVNSAEDKNSDPSSSNGALFIPTLNRLHGLLTVVSEELAEVPFFYDLSDLCSQVRCRPIPMGLFQSALINGGFKVSQTHKEPMAVKTNAPDSVVWDIVRCWCLQNPPEGSKHRKESNTASSILSKTPVFIADFTESMSVKTKSRALRHPPNPEENWGPKRKAGRPTASDVEAVTSSGVEEKVNIEADESTDSNPLKKKKK
jgi:tRNA (guanine26-N2/guanine27-N2)-dimethyltransferase